MMAKRLMGLLVLVQLVVVVVPLLGSEPGEKVKVAEGEYVMKIPPEAGGVEHRDEWVLWRDAGGGYEVESKIHFQVGNEEPSVLWLWVRLDGELQPEAFKVSGGSARGTKDLSCRYGASEFECEVAGKRKTLAVEAPYDFYPALSPWILSNMARRAHGRVGEIVPIRWIFADDEDAEGLPGLVVTEGEVRNLGEERVAVAERSWLAEKSEVELVPSVQLLLVWVSTDGVLVATQDAKRPEQRMELVRYEKYAEFGPGR